ncbi:hypothetical protein BJP36_38005 [Moorena producens JHB]|uniref:Uncharacterized protein n=1 Tax=Moorena producens (strain JHB) TaxID=1454205 RepID=A0A9Q9UWH8_MOOP1|nr:hypothetical protein [Moorena producens]WAN69889.1 hypothetical protein BJP36_38005 [Moorena producens JHB]
MGLGRGEWARGVWEVWGVGGVWEVWEVKSATLVHCSGDPLFR